MFGAKNRLAREIAHEVLKPLGVDVKDLKERSAEDFMGEMRRVVSRDQDNELYDRQRGWKQGEQ